MSLITSAVFDRQTGPALKALGGYIPTISAVAAVSGAVVAWVYRTASVRLGVVDLFASEIITLCRVGTTVDLIEHCIGALECTGSAENRKETKRDHYTPYQFTSQEEYFPIFSSNSRDLEVLEADVVTNVAAFYTYMKVARDYLRRIGNIQLQNITEWGETWRNIIYMEFLAYETARRAIDDLVEYEPRHVENTIIILLTEVVAFRFLLDKFDRDFRSARLRLRLPGYREIAEKLETTLRTNFTEPKGDKAEWDKAIELWPELRDRLERLDIRVGKLPDERSYEAIVPSHQPRGDQARASLNHAPATSWPWRGSQQGLWSFRRRMHRAAAVILLMGRVRYLGRRGNG